MTGSKGTQANLPPGPKGLPLVGNVLDLPKPGELEAHHWLKHKDIYGPISSITVFGQHLIIINDVKIATELLDKRALKYSDRPTQVFAADMIGWGDSLAFSQYGDRFRTYRKNMSRIIGSKSSAGHYNKLQEAEVGHFLLHVLENPDGLVDHIKRETGSIILDIAYGYRSEPFKNDPLIDMVGNVMEQFAVAAAPGTWLVDIFPFLRHLPRWLPGTSFKRTAETMRSDLQNVIDIPYAFVKDQLSQGTHNTSFLSNLLDAGDDSAEEKLRNKWSATALYTAGADTTVSAIACFFLAMTLHPEAQHKAQAEIDQVVGKNRLPNLSDRDSLPYVDALVKETLRWHPVAPMGLPHTSSQDDMIDGYAIPKGAMLLPNIWHFTHDPEVYQDPMTFRPERFLETEGLNPETDPHKFVFGFGRRICPGRVLADQALFLNVSQSLAVFNIEGSVTKRGNAVSQLRFTPGVISRPEPFEASITPRSSHHEDLIRSIEKTFPWKQGDGELLKTLERR
ncbi:putative cytochrome P450 oxidoreductase OrdA-like protein [Ilyonectria robusta]|uniref:putative cytochrome P450 oxidoreductase OrdA-like protein n=1 Tax=Ilyonectria robusta TaxID=1079257 RepID=UPI001E8ED0BF|nr:putative cytochrome P450 oxidoreductase OrdA-like protein [Ilyonectria robusta]KAH8684944.1 putative cytochrome P450 oxidoreductase OrdA-like protein [Ilyonectria robusta]